MAWWNSLKDLAGDVGGIASNPLVDMGLSVLPGGQFIAPAAAGLGSLFGAKKVNQGDKLQQQRLQQAQAGQADRDILRKRAMARLGNIPQRPNLGSLFAGSQNPFARGGGTPMAGPPPARAPLGPLMQ